MMDINRDLRLASLIYIFLDIKTYGNGIKYVSNKELAEELRKPIIRKFNQRKVHSPFTDNICVTDFADISK